MSTSGGTSGDGDSSATAHLNAAAMATMFSAPTVLIAAPGVGKVAVITSCVLEFKVGVDGFAGFPTPKVFYGSPAGQDAGVLVGETFPAGAPPTSVVCPPLPLATTGVGNGSYPRASCENQPLVVGVATANPDRAGPIVTATIAVAGTGYALNDTGTISADPNGYTGGATYRVTAVGALGIVTGFTVTAAGDGYTTTSNPLATATGGAQPGAGSGLTVNVTAIHAADGDLYVTATYRILTLH